MVKWIIENVNIEDKEFVTSRKVVISSFKPKDIKRVYHLPPPHKVYDKALVEKFATENEEPSKVIKQWRENLSKHNRGSLFIHAAMLCRLFGYANDTKFSVEWVPLIDAASNSTAMDWVTILSNNLACHIIEYRRNHYVTTRTIPPFYMSAYVIDVHVSFFLFLLWDGSGLFRIPHQSMCIIKLFGNPVSMNISIKIFKG